MRYSKRSVRVWGLLPVLLARPIQLFATLLSYLFHCRWWFDWAHSHLCTGSCHVLLVRDWFTEQLLGQENKYRQWAWLSRLTEVTLRRECPREKSYFVLMKKNVGTKVKNVDQSILLTAQNDFAKPDLLLSLSDLFKVIHFYTFLPLLL